MANENEHTPTPEELAAKVAAQDIAGQSTRGEGDPESLDALDKLAEAKSKEKEKAAAAPPVKPDIKVVEGKDGKPDVTPKPDDQKTEEQKKAEEAEAAKKKAAEEEALKQTDDIFKGIQLPPGARARSSEAFATIKLKAAQEITSLQSKLDAATKQIEEQEKKLKNPLSPELEAEIKELRTFRAKFDIEADPKWKEYDTRSKTTTDFIYAQLRKHPSVITDDVIKEIEKFGGPQKVNMDKILSAINDPTTTRIVQSKLADLEQTAFEKDQAIKTAKDNADEYLKTRSEEMGKAATQHTEATQQELQKLIAELPWIHEQKPTEKSTEEEKKAIEAHNVWVKDIQKTVEDSLRDDSAQMRALQIAGMAQLLFLQRVHAGTKAKLASTEKALEEANAKIEEFKKSKTTRLREVQPTGGVSPVKEKDVFHTTAQESLDKLRTQVLAEKEAKGA